MVGPSLHHLGALWQILRIVVGSRNPVALLMSEETTMPILLTLTQAKDHLRVTHDAEDALIGGLIDAADKSILLS